MDFGDFLSTLFEGGANGGGWRSFTAIVCLLLGVGIGGWLGYVTVGFPVAFVWACVGAFVGWMLGIFLRGFAIYIAFFLLVLAIFEAKAWLFGAA